MFWAECENFFFFCLTFGPFFRILRSTIIFHFNSNLIIILRFYRRTLQKPTTNNSDPPKHIYNKQFIFFSCNESKCQVKFFFFFLIDYYNISWNPSIIGELKSYKIYFQSKSFDKKINRTRTINIRVRCVFFFFLRDKNDCRDAQHCTL